MSEAYAVLHDEGIVSNEDYEQSNGYYSKSEDIIIREI